MLDILAFALNISATWSDWGAWQKCDTICGNGTQIRVKECVNPDFTKVSCEGNLPIESKTCNEGQCRKFLIFTEYKKE